MDLELQGRTALVTGASVGIGRGIAQVLAQEGVRVAVMARRATLLESLVDEISQAGGPVPFALAVDLAEGGAAERAGAAVLSAFGRVDILVNNAGGSRPAGLEASEEVWQDRLSLGFTAVRKLTHLLLPSMQQQQWGRVINITGANEPTHLNADQVAKAAQVAWAKGLSREVGRFGITINSVAPGRIMSEQIERMYPTPEAREQFAATHIPLGYFGHPHDVGYAVAFLASPKARYVSGSILYVDGGYHRFSF